jgi:2-dehydro-3-deoxyglucarate aldolase
MPFNRVDAVARFRHRLAQGLPLIGTWLQVGNSDYAEVIGDAGYDWAAIDMEHGAFSRHSLPDIFRALELGGTAPMARIANPDSSLCQQALDAGAAGVIIPRVETATQLESLIAACKWPPAGARGVGFSRANLYGKYFDNYKVESQMSFVVAQVESAIAVASIAEIATVHGLDAIMIGPYDLSASLGRTGDLRHPEVQTAIQQVMTACRSIGVASGIHVVQPSPSDLNDAIAAGHRFIAYGTDMLFLASRLRNPQCQ